MVCNCCCCGGGETTTAVVLDLQAQRTLLPTHSLLTKPPIATGHTSESYRHLSSSRRYVHCCTHYLGVYLTLRVSCKTIAPCGSWFLGMTSAAVDVSASVLYSAGVA